MKTKSEELFERFLETNKLPFEKIKEAKTQRPDYSVSIGNLKVLFEVKELTEDKKFRVVPDLAYPHNTLSSGKPGEHVRRLIGRSKGQVQYGAKQGFPSALLIYNSLDSWQMFGTQETDFTTAMYGELTTLLNKNTGKASELFNGKNQSLQDNKNTSFSAVGRLCDRQEIKVTLFENVFAAVKMPYELLPPCFDVRRVHISDEPLTVP
jgi:hypothetical protein